MKLQKVLKLTELEARDNLCNGLNLQAVRSLSERLLAQIILFNRRQGEVVKMLVVIYQNRTTQEVSQDVMHCLSKFEQDLGHTELTLDHFAW